MCALPSAAEEVSDGGCWAADGFDVMTALERAGLHQKQDEGWNAYGQLTGIVSYKPKFPARYTNVNGATNSLLPTAEWSFTVTATGYFGLKVWPGGELYAVPEVISLQPLSGLVGLGGTIQNFELQKTGSAEPTLYRSRLYLSQTIGLGGARQERPSRPMQLGSAVDARRVVVTLGNFSILDFLDRNSYAGDLRRQYLNMAFLTHAAYDFAADARGYAWGAVVEFYWDDWALRFGHLTPPVAPNQLELDPRFWEYFGQQVELEHDHLLFGRPGAVRLLGYRNRERTGRFTDAVAAWRADPSKSAANCDPLGFHYASTSATAPDLCWARKPDVKLGVGLNVEQEVWDGVGVFLRAMYSDGQTEVYAFGSTDMSLSFGVLAKGVAWRRPLDTAGVGVGLGWISPEHAEYLGLGGVDGFIGDGRITAATESVVELFYAVNVWSSLWVTVSWQHIGNPAFNADRGPVDVFGARVHAEF